MIERECKIVIENFFVNFLRGKGVKLQYGEHDVIGETEKSYVILTDLGRVYVSKKYSKIIEDSQIEVNVDKIMKEVDRILNV